MSYVLQIIKTFRQLKDQVTTKQLVISEDRDVSVQINDVLILNYSLNTLIHQKIEYLKDIFITNF